MTQMNGQLGILKTAFFRLTPQQIRDELTRYADFDSPGMRHHLTLRGRDDLKGFPCAYAIWVKPHPDKKKSFAVRVAVLSPVPVLCRDPFNMLQKMQDGLDGYPDYTKMAEDAAQEMNCFEEDCRILNALLSSGQEEIRQNPFLPALMGAPSTGKGAPVWPFLL